MHYVYSVMCELCNTVLKNHLRLIRGSMILDHTWTRFLGGRLIRRSDLYASIYGKYPPSPGADIHRGRGEGLGQCGQKRTGGEGGSILADILWTSFMDDPLQHTPTGLELYKFAYKHR